MGTTTRSGGTSGLQTRQIAPNEARSGPDPHVHSRTSPKSLHFTPPEPHIPSPRSPKSLRGLPISTRRSAAKFLSENDITTSQLFKDSSVKSQTLKAPPAQALFSCCELTQSQYRANMANSSLNKGSDGATGHGRSTARHDEAKITEIIGGGDTS